MHSPRGTSTPAMTDETTYRPRRRLKVQPALLTEKPGHVAQHFGAGVMFGVLLWLVRLADKHDRQHHQHSVRTHPTTQRMQDAVRSYTSHDQGIVVMPAALWRGAATACFRTAALAGPSSPFYEAGFTYDGSVIVPAVHTVAERGGRPRYIDCRVNDAVCQLADYVGRELCDSPNEFHPTAKWIEEVCLVVTPKGYGLDVWYGFERERGSHWHLEGDDGGWFIRPLHGESFAAFVARAHEALARVTLPAAEVTWSVFPIVQPAMKPHLDVGQDPAIGFVLAQSEERALAYWRANQPGATGDVEPLVGGGAVDPVAILPARDTWRECAVRVHWPGEWGLRHDEAWRITCAVKVSLVRMSGAPYRSATERRPFRGWILHDEVNR